MKLTPSSLFMVLPLALASFACGESSPEDAASEDSNLTNASGGGGTLAACKGRDECVRATVLGIFFTSKLELESVPPEIVEAPAPKRAAELVTKVGTKGHTNFEITTAPAGGGATKVTLNVFTVRPSDFRPTTELGCDHCQIFEDAAGLLFSFTIKNDKIVETKIPLGLAG
jgi:hypothetical protein